MKFGLQSYPETDLTTKATSIKPCQGLTILFYCLMIGKIKNDEKNHINLFNSYKRISVTGVVILSISL